MDPWICSQVECAVKDMMDHLEGTSSRSPENEDTGTGIHPPSGQSWTDPIICSAVESVMEELLDQVQHLIPNLRRKDIAVAASAYHWTKDDSTSTIQIETKVAGTCARAAQAHDVSTQARVEMSSASTLTEMKERLDQSSLTDPWQFEIGTMTENSYSSLLVNSSTSPKMKFQFAKNSPLPQGQGRPGKEEDKENRGLMESIRKTPMLRIGLSRHVAQPLLQNYKMESNDLGN